MSSERSTVNNNSSSSNNDYVPRTHNIFDMSAPAHHQPPPTDKHSPGPTGPSSIPAHFNSTLPALNSSMRYEPLPDPSPTDGANGWRNHSPSPHPAHPYAVSRSRSRSRPPSAYPGPGSPSIPGVGPQRTTRTRRGNSVSSMNSTSPPPQPSAQAIVIPRNHHGHEGNNSGSWFGPGSQGSTASEYTLPTPESLHHGHSPGSFHGHGFANLSLNVSNLSAGLGGGSPMAYNPPGFGNHNQHQHNQQHIIGVPSQWPSKSRSRFTPVQWLSVRYT
ncbi:hypothetical protein BT96DRAFT_391561 [Gymnopus androsaceus JB14]|uniref:Uncharacterized protein n=1 Tax=Gymnopus androsaceus JB14 TaxID=1447944 RepID=A0A6A4GVB7_9AGAR|nr:hypothetical protein BT96DRAFT_391561 [Gymnopus androsaceus JB14]